MLSNERPSGYMREHNQLSGWSSDENDWNEKLYPVWKRGDSRWKSSWKGKSKDSKKKKKKTQTPVISSSFLFFSFKCIIVIQFFKSKYLVCNVLIFAV